MSERAGDRLVPLGEIGEGRFGIKTGENEFFYVKSVSGSLPTQGTCRVETGGGAVFELPVGVLEPAILRTGHVLRPRLTPGDADCLLVSIPGRPKSELHALVREYIGLGEQRGFSDQSTVRSRRYWYSIEAREPGWVLTPMARKRRAMGACREDRGALADA